MIVSQSDARKIIAEVYGADFKFRLTARTTIGVRPAWQVNLNMPMLAWRKLTVDRKGDLPSAVYLGRVQLAGTIDWNAVDVRLPTKYETQS